jgi:type I restriction-modification system DNA methylase subunit
MPAPTTVLELVERFRSDLPTYKSVLYKETEVRQEFIDPLFAALGWDIGNRRGAAATYREVVLEYSMKIGDTTRAPDYLFRVDGSNRFFVEAKKPSVNLRDGVGPAYQVRRYAWTEQHPLSILTDFEEFAIYDCRVKPDKTDKANVARYRIYSYEEFADKWDEIAEVFSREAVLAGSLEKFAQEQKAPKGALPVDKAFLAEIDGWRALLAKNIAIWNPALTQRELNYAVQMTLDRLIFLRIGEDRGIELYGKLQGLLKGGEVYKRLIDQFRDADDRYNSGLFHFKDEKGREGPDSLTPGLHIDDEPLKRVIRNLYYPDSPYEFSVLPIEVLGNVYEQFLGKVITIGAERKVEVEEKPEVRKAGGVYYTPSYIVEYIVKNTVGKLLEGKTPKEAAKLRIVDPACGSGSFLIGAYQHLLNWHLAQYEADEPAKRRKELYRGANGDWRLTTSERKRILLNNIYGVDIDTQAVEVTKLSLSLKMLEGETEQTLGTTRQMFQERALPDLSSNVKCGNSLVRPDFYDSPQAARLSDDELYRINAFDWETEFSAIIRSGGFDAIIGNPPWLMAGYYVTDTLDYLRDHYKSAQGKFDLYYLFIEQGCRLLSNTGLFGMIIPNKFFHTKAASYLRSFLAAPKWIRQLVDFGDEQIFTGATNYSCILILAKDAGAAPRYTKAQKGLTIIQEFEVPWSVLSETTWYFEEQGIRSLFEKIEQIGTSLEGLTARFGTGVQSGADTLLMIKADEAAAQGLEFELLRRVLRGRDVRRYAVADDMKLLIFPYKVQDEKFVVLSEDELQRCEKVNALLEHNKEKLAQRIWFDKNAEELSGKWYGMMYLDAYTSFSRPHILTPSLSNCSNFAIGQGVLFATGTAGVTSVIPRQDLEENIFYLLGLLNSSLLSFYAISHSPIFSGGYYKFSAPYLKKLPIRTINFSDSVDKARHDQMVILVERMLDLHKRLPAAKTAQERTVLQRQVETTDRQIDNLVYELYGLLPDEREIVERATK